MRRDDDFLKKSLGVLEQEGIPTEQQKETMLNQILSESKENSSVFDKLKKIIVAYPWRFAFATSAVQAIALTLIFGTQYTNFFLGFFGG